MTEESNFGPGLSPEAFDKLVEETSPKPDSFKDEVAMLRHRFELERERFNRPDKHDYEELWLPLLVTLTQMGEAIDDLKRGRTNGDLSN